jgi:hypothetical protein
LILEGGRISSLLQNRFTGLVLASSLVLPWLARAGSYQEHASAKERKKLDKLTSEIDGVIVYSRPPHKEQGEKLWMIERLSIGQWKAETVAEGVCARWSPDGQRLAVFRSHVGRPKDNVTGSIWVMNPDGSGQKQLAVGALSRAVRGACPMDFHPNNAEIVFIREDGGISSVGIETGKERDWRLPGSFDEEIQLTADGRYLAGRWRGRGDWAMNRRMVIVDVHSKIHRVYGAGCCPAISPDGNWMAINHDGHYRMSICHRDIRDRVEFWSSKMIHPQHGLHNWHWSNHNDYLAVKSEVYRDIERDYKGAPDGFIIKFSERRATRVTFEQEAEFPDLYVTRDHQSGPKIPSRGYRSVPKEVVRTEPYSIAKIFRTHGETREDPGRPSLIPRIEIEAELTALTPLDYRQAAQYQNCLVENVYAVRKVIRGQLDESKIVVVHWAVRNRKVVSHTQRLRKGRTYRLILEAWHLHPELKAEPRKSARLGKGQYPFRFYDAGLTDQLNK